VFLLVEFPSTADFPWRRSRQELFSHQSQVAWSLAHATAIPKLIDSGEMAVCWADSPHFSDIVGMNRPQAA